MPQVTLGTILPYSFAETPRAIKLGSDHSGGWADTRYTKNRGRKSEILTRRGMGDNAGPGPSVNEYGIVNFTYLGVKEVI